MANILAVSEWLEQSCCLQVPIDWLTACVEWIEEENEGSNLTLEQIKNLVYDQWLLSDLCDLKTQYLPADIQNEEKCEVTGPIPLQINKIVDIGVSTYSQLQKLQGTENENANVSADQPKQPSWEPKPSRMLLMQLTDGTMEIQGMEYKSIPDLNPDLPPGIKIILLGTVLCRRAMLLLKRENVKVLGGEVDTLIEANSRITVLQDLIQTNKEDSGKEYKQTYEAGPIQRSKCIEDMDDQNNIKSEIQNQGTATRNQYNSRTSSITQNNAYNVSRNSSHASSVASQNINNSNYGKVAFNKQNVKPKMEEQHLSEQEWDTDFNYEELIDEMDDFNDDDLSALDCQVSSNSNQVNTWYPKPPSTTQPININININMPQQINKPKQSDKLKLSTSRKQNTSHNPPSVNMNSSRKTMNQREVEGTSSGLESLNKQKVSADVVPSNYLEDVDFDDDFEVTASWKTPVKQTAVFSTNSLSNTKSSKPVTVKQKQTTLRDSLLSNSVKRKDSLSTTSSPLSSINQKRKRNSVDELPNTKFQCTMDTFMNNRNAGSLDEVENPISHRESESISRQPFTYLSAINKYLQETDVKKVKFTVKAYVSTLSSALGRNSGQRWSLSCKINDGTGSLDCDISNIVLVELIGFSAAESQTMQKRLKEEPELKDIMREGIQQCQEKLINLSCIMEVDTTRFSEKSEITKLVPLTEQHTKLLHNIVSNKVNKIF